MGQAKQTASISNPPASNNPSKSIAALESVADENDNLYSNSPSINAAIGEAFSASTLGLGLHGLPPISVAAPKVPEIHSTDDSQLDGAGQANESLLGSSKPRTSYGALISNGPIDGSEWILPPMETEALLQDEGSSGKTVLTWEEAVMAGFVKTTWQKEAKVLFKYSAPLIITFLLQYSLPTASVLAAGNLGKNELAAVSLAGMTAAITGFAIFQGNYIDQTLHNVLILILILAKVLQPLLIHYVRKRMEQVKRN